MKVVGYIRVSTERQDASKQKHTLLEYAQKRELLIREFIEIEVSSKRTKKERGIERLLGVLESGDTLLATELSRLGRNMLETLNIIDELSRGEISIIFVRQPELSTDGAHGKLLTAIYGYFAEAEREYISLRTKEGLAAARAKGKLLGRPKGSKNKKGSVLSPFKEQIKEYLKLKLPVASIVKIINNQLEKPLTYNSFRYFILHDEELRGTLRGKKGD